MCINQAIMSCTITLDGQITYMAFHHHFGSDATSVSFAFNWSRGRGATLMCEARIIRCSANKGTSIDFMWRHYQSVDERPYKYFFFHVFVTSAHNCTRVVTMMLHIQDKMALLWMILWIPSSRYVNTNACITNSDHFVLTYTLSRAYLDGLNQWPFEQAQYRPT